jgi:hypothetical protein
LRFVACHERPSGERYGDNRAPLRSTKCGGARPAIRKVMEDRVGSWRRAAASPASIEELENFRLLAGLLQEDDCL